MSRQEVQALVRHARTRNDAAGITGLLVYDHQSFLQILEGEPEAVDSCFARIERDPRHHQIDVLGRHSIEKRAFKTWRMGAMVYDGTD